MDTKTISYYAQNAEMVAKKYESIISSLSPHFKDAFKPNSKLLDIGCGSGRDLALLHGLGYNCYGIDATAELVTLSQTIHPELRGRIKHAYLPNLEPPFKGDFDAVLCSAVLMHIPQTDWLPSALAIRQCTRKHGRLLYSIPSRRSDILSDSRDIHQRLFVLDHAEHLLRAFEQTGFKLISKHQNPDSLNRKDFEWHSYLLELSN
jgi:2-polyprenyl-3-methyl-5-hydroxy-6-metoxy-1,4-benzoquinol methylase